MMFEAIIYSPALNFAAQRNNQEIINILLVQHKSEINSECFIFCNKMTQITIPPSATSIEDYAFFGCSSLSSISIPSVSLGISSKDQAFF